MGAQRSSYSSVATTRTVVLCVMVTLGGFCPSTSYPQCISLGLLVPRAQAGLDLGMGCEELAMGLRGCEL